MLKPLQTDSIARKAWNDGRQKKIVLPAKDLSELCGLKMDVVTGELRLAWMFGSPNYATSPLP